MPSSILRCITVLVFLALAAAACAPAHRATPPASQTARQKAPAKSSPQPKATLPAPAQAPAPATAALPPEPAAPAQQAVATPPPGFGTLSWGASAKSDPGLALYDTDPATGATTFIWPKGPREIAGVPIREAFYEFFQDRFYHVWIDFDGMAAYKAALAGLIRSYGPPTTENPEKYYHAWSFGEVNIYCAYHAAENGGDVSFFYQPIYDQLAAAKKARPAKTAQRSAKP